MADTLATRPPADADHRELVAILRSIARTVREMEAASDPEPPPAEPAGPE